MITRKTFDKTVYCGLEPQTRMCIMVHVSCDMNLDGGITRKSADFAEVYFDQNHNIEKSEHRSKAQAIALWNEARPGLGETRIEETIESLVEDLKVEATNFFGNEKFNDFKAEFAALLKKYKYEYYDPEIDNWNEIVMPNIYDTQLFTDHYIKESELPKH